MRYGFPGSQFIAATVALLVTAGAEAAILLDFGPNAVTNVSPGFDATVSPAHNAGAVPTSEVAWNTVPTSGIGALVNSDGSPATGVTLVLGTETSAGSNNISFSTGPAGSLSGTAVSSTGVYSGTRPQRDGVFNNVAGSALGLRIDGLAAGSYSLYFTARNTNTNTTTNREQRMYASTGTLAGTYDFSEVSNFQDVTNTGSINATTFTLGENYNILNFDIATGQSLFLAVDGTTSEELRGFLNAVAIVAVPEPASTALLGLAALGIFFRRRRSN